MPEPVAEGQQVVRLRRGKLLRWLAAIGILVGLPRGRPQAVSDPDGDSHRHSFGFPRISARRTDPRARLKEPHPLIW
jgi:hypothetical protein